MSNVKFELKPVETKPSRSFKKGSKYDPVIDEFLEGKESLVEVTVKGKTADYLRNQLSKRIESRGLGEKLETSAVNDCCYLEKK